MCGKKGTEVHHIHPQKDANEGFIQTESSLFHKNQDKYNLIDPIQRISEKSEKSC